SLVCEVGGGQCQSNNDGVCTAFPLAGANRGSDDYRRDSPADEGIKLHCPTCGSPVWLDLPGMPATGRGMANADYRQEADFYMFLKGAGGGGSCSCHARLLIDWDGTNHVFRAGTGMTVIRDAESVMCR